jgi:POT family proton-dependent oligopeptide transporter
MSNGIRELKENSQINSHPPALFTLFFTEMWERFSFYGMRALLVFYLTKHIGMSDHDAGKIYGSYTALVYLTPLIGGYLADAYLGNRKSVYIGGILMMLGHLSLSLNTNETLYLGLALLILGNGFFKPNMTSMFGVLYDSKPQLKDAGYMLFYVGINLGASLGTILCGYVGEKINWHYGFGLAGIGMFLGIVQFYFGSYKLGEIGKEPVGKNLSGQDDSLSSKEWTKVNVILILTIFNILFWMCYEQMGSSLNLYTDRRVDRLLFDFEVPASFYQSINPILIIILGPLVSAFWAKQETKGNGVSIPLKFTIAFVLLGLGYFSLYFGDIISGDKKISPGWLLIFYFLVTVGELYISPVGLSMISKLAPARKVGFVVGVWFLSISIAHYFAGWISGGYAFYLSVSQFFLALSVVGLIGAIFLFSVNKYLYNMMNGDTNEPK